MRIIGIIPARYASTRFPGKSLALIAGKSLIQRVVERLRANPDESPMSNLLNSDESLGIHELFANCFFLHRVFFFFLHIFL